MQHKLTLVVGLAVLFSIAPSVGAQILPDTIDISNSPNGIVSIPSSITPVIRNLFNRYTKITAPNGRAIHFLMQSNVTDEQAVRAREVLRFFITDVAGSLYGANKNVLANSMSNMDATLAFFNSEQSANSAFNGAFGNLNLFIQDLYATESIVEGSSNYITNNERDATLEEVFHLVHGAGIQPTLPAYHSMIWAATTAATNAGKWTPPGGLPFQDRPFEYIISVIDVYYGFWAHDPDEDGSSFGGEYIYNTRAGVSAGDPGGVAAMLAFLPPYFSANLTVSASFNGTFRMVYSPGIEYTHKSQYLVNIALSGSNSSSVLGNQLDNTLAGNAGNNTLNGGAGNDTAVFQGNAADYALQFTSSGVTVSDSVSGRDGTDSLINLELLQFADATVPIRSGASSSTSVISLSLGGTQTLSFSGGVTNAQASYAVAGSASGVHPGINVSGGLHIPLNVDSYTTYTIANPASPYFTGFTGTLNGQGHAQASLSIPAGFVPSLAGIELHHLFVANIGGGSHFISNPVSLTLVP